LYIKCPGVMLFWRLDIEAAVLHALVKFIDFFFTLLPKANVKHTGVFDMLSALHQREYHALIVEQHRELAVPTLPLHPEVLFEKGSSPVNIRHREIDVIENHAFASKIPPLTFILGGWCDDGGLLGAEFPAENPTPHTAGHCLHAHRVL